MRDHSTRLMVAVAVATTAVPAPTQDRDPRTRALAELASFEVAMRRNALDVAAEHLDNALGPARATQHESLLAWTAQLRQRLDTTKREWMAIARLDLDERELNARRGAYLALWLGDFETGLEQLSHGKLTRWKALAAAERAPELDQRECERLGDMWLDQAHSSLPAFAQTNVRRRALLWLQRSYRAGGPRTSTIAEKIRSLLVSLLPNDGPAHMEFRRASDLEHWLRQGGEWSIQRNQLVGRYTRDTARATYRYPFSNIECVRIRGRIESENNQNFRFSVGPVNVILNWECAAENHCRYIGKERFVAKTHAMQPGKEHEILCYRIGDDVRLTIDGTTLWTSKNRGPLSGTVSVYPAFSSIAVSEVSVLGTFDQATTVTKPSHRTY